METTVKERLYEELEENLHKYLSVNILLSKVAKTDDDYVTILDTAPLPADYYNKTLSCRHIRKELLDIPVCIAMLI